MMLFSCLFFLSSELLFQDLARQLALPGILAEIQAQFKNEQRSSTVRLSENVKSVSQRRSVPGVGCGGASQLTIY